TVGDYRQMPDALFHAGTNFGSEYEFVDTANRVHFYILDVQRDARGVLSYTVAIRSLDGAGPQQRGVQVMPGTARTQDGVATCSFPVVNLGRAAPPTSQHPEPVTQYIDGDVYRVSATAANGWTVSVPNALATAKFGGTVNVPVHAQRNNGPVTSKVTLTAVSESNPNKQASATCTVVSAP
ncbi:MAG TPA: peptidase M6, partial [Lentzea sp.]